MHGGGFLVWLGTRENHTQIIACKSRFTTCSAQLSVGLSSSAPSLVDCCVYIFQGGVSVSIVQVSLSEGATVTS